MSGLLRESLLIPGGDEPIPAVILRPADRPPGPAIIVLHGQGRDLSKETHLVDLSAEAARGATVVSIDLRLHGDRRRPDLDTSGAIPVLDFHAMVTASSADVVAVTEYLLDRVDLSNGSLGVGGFSLGACVALVAAVRDPRLAAILLMGTPILTDDDPAHYPTTRPDPVTLRHAVAQNDPFRMLDRLPPRPVLFVHGERDVDAPLEEVRELHAALAQRYASHKASPSLEVYSGGHHPPWRVRRRAWRWLTRTMHDRSRPV